MLAYSRPHSIKKVHTLKKRLISISLFFFLLSMLISPTRAETEINMQSIPNQLAEKLGIPLFAGQILASGIVIFIPLLSIAIIARGKYHHAWIAELFVGLMFLSFTVAIGWCPYWLLIILSMLIALMFAGQMRDLITGRGR